MGSSDPDHREHIECATTRGLDPHTIARALCTSGPIRYQTLYNTLRIRPEEHPAVLLTEATVNPKVNRERMTRLMFEALNMAATLVAIQVFLFLCASREMTGVAWDFGENVSHTVLFFAGLARPCTILLLFFFVSDRVSGEDPHSARAPPLQNVGVVGQVVLLLL